MFRRLYYQLCPLSAEHMLLPQLKFVPITNCLPFFSILLSNSLSMYCLWFRLPQVPQRTGAFSLKRLTYLKIVLFHLVQLSPRLILLKSIAKCSSSLKMESIAQYAWLWVLFLGMWFSSIEVPTLYSTSYILSVQ